MLRTFARTFTSKYQAQLAFTDGKVRIYNDAEWRQAAIFNLGLAAASAATFGYSLTHLPVLTYPILASQTLLGTFLGVASFMLSRSNKTKVRSIDLLACGTKLVVVFNSHLGFEYTNVIDIAHIIDTSGLNSAKRMRAREKIDIFLVKPRSSYWINSSSIEPEFADMLKAVLREGKEVEVTQQQPKVS